MELDGDHAGDAAHCLAPADDGGDAFFVDGVLQGNDETVRRQVLADQRRRPFGVVGLGRDDGDVDRLLARQRFNLGQVQGANGYGMAFRFAGA